MEKKDLLEYSPVRYFDKATTASLKAGEMGLVSAKKGLGKTSVLVQFALDDLLKDKTVVHVSFDQHSSNVISWYTSVMAEIAKKKNLSNLSEISEEIVRNRIILNFNRETFTLPKVVKTLKALKEGGLNIDAIIVDGLDVDKRPIENIKCFKDYIVEENITAWFSLTNESPLLAETLPAEKLDLFATVTHIFPNGGDIYLGVLKNGEGKVSLDSKTLLMSKK